MQGLRELNEIRKQQNELNEIQNEIKQKTEILNKQDLLLEQIKQHKNLLLQEKITLLDKIKEISQDMTDINNQISELSTKRLENCSLLNSLYHKYQPIKESIDAQRTSHNLPVLPSLEQQQHFEIYKCK